MLPIYINKNTKGGFCVTLCPEGVIFLKLELNIEIIIITQFNLFKRTLQKMNYIVML